MINQHMYDLGAEPSAIRELFAYGLARKAEIGEDKVFDFSIGNPSIPAPAKVKETVLQLMEKEPCALHGYTPAPGDMRARKAVADSIARRFNIDATPEQVYFTAGAAGGIAIALAAITNPGDEVLVISPYFPEYRVWIEQMGCTCVEVPAHQPDFQIDNDAVAAAINNHTSALIINSPNNPVGAVYTRENLEGLAEVLRSKEAELNRPLYLISDEPYREITYGKEVPYVPCLYARTIVCYSYSKSLSLPGERIGYIYVSDLADDAQEVMTTIAGAGRALGAVCAPVLWQRVIAACVDEPSDVASYAENRALLTEGLSKLGYEFVEPDGAFYLWVRALEPDAQAFSERAKAHELLLVPSDSFGVTGWVRVSYCIAKKTIEDAMPAFEALMNEYK